MSVKSRIDKDTLKPHAKPVENLPPRALLTRTAKCGTMGYLNESSVGIDQGLPSAIDFTHGTVLDEIEFVHLVELLAGLEPMELDAAYAAAKHIATRQREQHEEQNQTQQCVKERVVGSRRARTRWRNRNACARTVHR